MNISIVELSVFIGALVTIWGAIALIYKPISNFIRRLERLERHQVYQNADIADSMEQREVMLSALMGLLNGMIEQGLNGEVTKAHCEMLEYMKKRPFRQNRGKEL
mgnify:CR=1 FL=1